MCWRSPSRSWLRTTTSRRPTTRSGSSRSPGGVYALYGRGGNVGFFVGPDAVLVVGSQFRDLAPGIVEKIKSVSDKPIKFLVNTHHHPDHVGGNEVFKRFAIIVAHDNVRKHVWHTTPAHTDGDCVVYFENAKVLHMGDLLFNIIPVIDVRGGGTPKGYLPALDSVLARLEPGVTIIPGHGEVTDAAGLRAFRQYIADVVELARTARAAGKTREAFVAEAELPAYKDWSGYPQRFKENAGAAFDEVR